MSDVFDELLRLIRPERLLDDPRATGEGVRVCVVDSGVDRARLRERHPGMHPVEGAVFREDRPDVLPDPGTPSSPHGTTVADIVLAVAPRVTLYSADVFGPLGTCDARVIIRAVRHAMDAWGCRVINLSLGIPEPRLQLAPRRMELLRVIEEAYYRDVLIVAAASNDHPVTRSYPAAFAPPLLSVDKGAFGPGVSFAYRLHEQVEFQAKGVGYLGPFAAQPATSWAAPHLSGVAARLLSLRPGLKPFEMKALLYWLSRGGEVGG
ncbi:MAG: S8 family serine peptidase [Gemmataceae bacterium]